MSLSTIMLIGMPGAGKSTIGKLLAEQLLLPFIDGDDHIHQASGLRPQKIIDTHGEEYFLRLERDLFMSKELFNKKPLVFAPGGSVVYSDKLMQYLKTHCTIVLLDVPFTEIERRLTISAPRGIIGSKNKTLEKLYNERAPLYKMYADITVSCDKLSQDAVVKRIITAIS